MSRYDFDLFTIGAGSGGIAGSRRAASYGARVAIAENRRIGGTCVLRGCVPKKLLVYGSHFADDLEDASGFGWHIPEARLDWSALVAAKNREIDRLHGIYVGMLDKAGVRTIEGHASVIDRHTVEIDGKRYTAETILVATGGRPVVPDLPGRDVAITSDEALDLGVLPERIVIVGGGYIALEFASIFNAAGSKVTLLVRGPALLRNFDGDIAGHLAAELRGRGIEVRLETRPTAIRKSGGGHVVVTPDAGKDIEADQVLFATGRVPNGRSLGLEEIGVKLAANGAVMVDDWSRTSIPSIYAVGDVTDRFNLTPVAIAEARALAETLFNNRPTRVDPDFIPTAVFSRPPVGTVGLSEEAARRQGQAIDVYMTRFRPMKHTLSGRDTRTMVKLVVRRGDDRVLGCHIVGDDAPEIIQGFAVALKCGATKEQFDATVGLHPTAAEELVTLRDKRL